MRKNRVVEQNRCYHLVSRLAHRAFFLDDEEKDRAVALMRRVEAGVQASMSYCINRTVSISSDPFDPLPRREAALEEQELPLGPASESLAPPRRALKSTASAAGLSSGWHRRALDRTPACAPRPRLDLPCENRDRKGLSSERSCTRACFS